MLLAVDVGNTQTHFGAFAGEQLLEHWRFATVRQSTADELGAALSSLLDLRGYGFDDLDASIVSSTVPQLEPEWTAMAERYLGHQMLVVGPGTKTGMAIRYDNPARDRRRPARQRRRDPRALRSARGVRRLRHRDHLRRRLARGRLRRRGADDGHRDIARSALRTRRAAAQDRPRATAQRDRQEHVDAIRSGVVFGYAGAIDAILRRLYDELGERTEVIATGGLARLVVPYTEEIEEVDDLLTLTGLRLLHERNS